MTALAKLIDTTAQVAIIADRDAVGRSIAQALTRLHFRNTQIFKSCDAFWRHDGNAQFNWALLALSADNFEAMLQFLEHRNQEPRHNSLAASAFVHQRHMPLLPQLFERGLLSCHALDQQVSNIEHSIQDVIRVARENDKREPYVAAHFLRQFLRQQRFFSELLNLEQTMASFFYEDSENYLRLAEAQFLAGQRERGKLTLAELQHFDSSISARISLLYEEHLGSVYDDMSTFADQQSLRRVVIIDPDRKSANTVSLALSKIGVRDAEIFADGQAAWDELSAGDEPDLIVCEWQLPGLSGPYLLQRLRDHGFFRVPVVVVSHHLERSDHQLLKELTVSQIMRKPLQEKQTLMAIAWSVSQHRLPTEAKSIERKVIEALREDDVAVANSLRHRFLQMTKVSQARKLYIEGAFSYHEKRYEQAVAQLTQSLHTREGDNVDVVALLGRALLKMGDPVTAMRMFEKASALSPLNIKRLCELADTQIMAGKLDDAANVIAQVKQLDANAPQVHAASAKFAVVTGDLDSVATLVGNMTSFQEIISFINSLAIAKSRKGDFKESLALYKNLLKILAGKEPSLQAVVLYNQSICHLRAGESRDGALTLKQAISVGDTLVSDKAMRLQGHLERARKEGKNLRFAEQEEVLMVQANDHEEKLTATLETQEFWAKKQKGRTAAGLLGVYRVASALGPRTKKSERQAS